MFLTRGNNTFANWLHEIPDWAQRQMEQMVELLGSCGHTYIP